MEGIKMKVNYYRCNLCKKIVEEVVTGPGKLVCCGQDMELLVANTTDAATEKHVPVVTIDGNRVHVSVGDVAHPMTAEHSIQSVSYTHLDVYKRQIVSRDKGAFKRPPFFSGK